MLMMVTNNSKGTNWFMTCSISIVPFLFVAVDDDDDDDNDDGDGDRW